MQTRKSGWKAVLLIFVVAITVMSIPLATAVTANTNQATICETSDNPGGGLITRDRMIEIAEGYKTHRWTPTSENVFHGIYKYDGQRWQVDTPDESYNGGWWKPGQENIGIPYQWGGFSSISGFDDQYRGEGQFAGNKHYAGDVYCHRGKPECPKACGVDCSGFVSRCWNLKSHHSTYDLADISWPITFENLQKGDILNKAGEHVVLFKEFTTPDKKRFKVYEASDWDWKVSEREYEVVNLIDRWEGGYKTTLVTFKKDGKIFRNYKPYSYFLPPFLSLSISGTARVADYDRGVYVVGTSEGELYVINEMGKYTVTQLGAGSINDVRIEYPFIAVAAGNTVIKLSLIGLTPQESWRITLPGFWSNRAVSVDLSQDGNYVAYLSRYDSVGIIKDGSIITSYSIYGSWMAHWLDATKDMEYIAITAEVGPPEADYWGVNTGVELYRFDGSNLVKMWGRVLIYDYETTEVRISEAKDYVAVATSSGTMMNLLDLATGNILWQYDASPQEQFACDGDDNLNYVIGGTQAWSAPYRWFVLKNLGTSYKLIAEGHTQGAINDLDSDAMGLYFAFGSDAGEFILLIRTGDTVKKVLEGNVAKLIDAIEIGRTTLLVGGDSFIKLYSITGRR